MKCPKCQFDNPEGAKFCIECGHKFGEELAIEEERKQVTVLFSDLTEYTSMSERLDPEEVKNIMSRIFGEVTQLVTKYDGSIQKFMGDAVVAFFGVPKVHEDDPVRAIRTALEIHELVDGISPQFESRVGKRLAMHTGINTGLVVTGEITTGKGTLGVTGDTVNVASRLSGLAKPGEILVGEDTYRQAEWLFNFAPLTPVSVKGKAEPVRACKVLSSKEKATKTHRLSGLRSELIGRKVEMSQLKEAAQQLLEGKGAIFYITGDAGTGKSRLIEEFKATLDLNKIQWREGHSYAYASNIPYFPLMDLLSRAWQIEEGDSQERLKQKIEAGITNLMGDGKDVVPFIGSLYSIKYPEIENISPEYWKMKLHESVQFILSALTRRAPAVICLEDLHWTDPSSIELLRTILLKFNYPALFLCVSRPQFSLFTSHQLSGIGKSYYEMRLQDLSPTEAQGMVESLLKTETIPVELRNFILRKAEGNPFYLEEVINSLIETETLTEKDNTWVLTRPLAGIDIPSNVRGVISARLDRLEKETKRILQEASVIGRVFFYEILKRITEFKEQIDLSLQGLERLDLIRTRSLDPEVEYIFKHALTQEVAYNSLLLKRRKEIHKRIGKAIEELYPERLEEFYEMLAYHYARGEALVKASQYLKLSGSKAARNHSLWEAYGFYKEALAALRRLPETAENKKEKLEVLVLMVIPMIPLPYPEGSLEMLQEGENLSKELRDNRRLALFRSRVGHYYTYRGNHLLGVKYSEDAFEEGRKSQDIDLIAPLAWGLCASYLGTGQYNKIVDIAPGVLDLLEKTEREFDFFAMSVNPYSHLCGYCGMSMGYLGNFEEGKIFLEKGLRHAAQIGDLRTLGNVEWFWGIFFHIKGEWKPAIEHLQNCIKYSEEVKYLAPLAWAWAFLGNVYSSLGDLETGRRYVEKGLKIQRNAGFEWFLSFYPYFLGDICLQGGDLKNARSFMDEALRVSQKNDEKLIEGLSWIGLGRILGRAETPQIHEAGEYILQGMKILDELKLKPSCAGGYLALKELYFNAGQKDKALENLKKAEAMFQQMGMDYWLARTKELLEKVRV